LTEELADIFAIAMGGFSVMGNHLHVLVRLDQDIAERLGSSAESWRARLEKLRTRRSFGRSFAASREKLREAAARLNMRRDGDLAGCPAR
jgi:hypothetical protein